MQAIIFIGIQATGKTTFYLKNFFDTHVHISLDKLNTRNKEMCFLKTCFDTQTPFVIDNTNPTKADRKKYIDLAHQFKYTVLGYYFESTLQDSLERNAQREGKKRIPDVGIRSTLKKLEIPENTEGYTALFKVTHGDGGAFTLNQM